MAASLRKRNPRRGSAMLESSFIFIVFFSLLIGAFDFGQFLFIHQALVERARWAARWGMAYGGTNDQIRNMVVYGQPTSGSQGYLGLENSMVTVTTNNADTWNWNIAILLSNYPYKMLSPYIAGTYTGPNIYVTVPLGKYN